MRLSERQINALQILSNAWDLGQATDNVRISIYDIDDNALDVNQVAMTLESGAIFSYSWTPSQNHTYRIDYYNVTLDSHDFEVINVKDLATTSSGGGSSFVSGGSSLTVLRNRFLKLIDNYNGSDLSGTNSSGEVADLCLNDGLQTIYAIIKASRHTDAYSSTALVSVANQAYIDLSAITDIDEIVAIMDTTNQWKLTEVSPEWYFRNVPDPSGVTGTAHIYTRIFNRIYLNPRPTSAITYTTQYKKAYPPLTNDSDTALIPSKYDRWIMAEAWVIWLMGEDINAVGAIQIAQAERERCEQRFLNDIFSNFDYVPMSASHFLENENRRWLPYQSPMDGT